MRQVVLITGCSTGIGRETALYLAQHGYEVFAGVRREESLSDLKSLGVAGLIPLKLDVLEKDEIEHAFKEVKRHLEIQGHGTSFHLINNAGLGLGFPAEVQPEEVLREVMEVNFYGSVRTTQVFLPLLRKFPGKIIFVTSINGKLALPLMSAYAASKFATEAYADALRRELKVFASLSVVVVEPGSIRTPIFERAHRRSRSVLKNIIHQEKSLYEKALLAMDRAVAISLKQASHPRSVAKRIYRILQLRSPSPRYRVGLDAHLQYLLAQFFPDRWLDALLTLGFRWLMRLP